MPSRWGTQTPFTNLTFDWTCPEDLREQVPVIGGVEMPFTYGELQAEMDMINRAYIEVMTAGDAKGRVFTFPIPTYNITPDFPWEAENAERLFAMTAKYGLPYFQNFINSELKPNMIRSMCCRLQLDLRELLKRGNGLFGSAEQTGSVGVVTVNCARLGYLYKGDEAGLLRAPRRAARHGAQRPGDQAQGDPAPDGRRPVPLHQALSRHAAQPLLDHRRERRQRDDPQLHRRRTRHHHANGATALPCGCSTTSAPASSRFQEETGHMYNLEATPAEGTTYRFAKEDRKRYPGHPAGRHGGTRPTTPTRRSCRWATPTIRSKRWSGRTNCSASTPAARCCTSTWRERISSAEACRKLVRRALERFRLPYITVTPTFSICPKHGYLAGEHEFCPRCDEDLLAKKRREAEAA